MIDSKLLLLATTVGLCLGGASSKQLLAQDGFGGSTETALILPDLNFSDETSLEETPEDQSALPPERPPTNQRPKSTALRLPVGRPKPSSPSTAALPDLRTRPEAGGDGEVSLTGQSSALQPSPPPSASFDGVLDNATSFNPDTSGAVGPNHIVMTLGGLFRIKDRNGQNISTRTLSDFWVSYGNPDVYDPRIVYDPYANRWIHSAVANFTTNPGLLLAVSTSSDPTGTWHRYFIDVDSSMPIFAESPNLGFNRNWIVIQANMFDKTTLEFTVSEIFAFNKTSAYAGNGNVYTRFTLADNSFGETSFGGPINAQVPAVTMDNAQNTLYLVSHWVGDGGSGNFDDFGFLRLFRISGPVNSPTFTPAEFVTTFDPAPWAPFDPNRLNTLPQRDTSDRINAGDTRIQNVVFRGGTLWTTHTVFLPSDNPNRASVQWWEIIPTVPGEFAETLQFGRIDDSSANRMFAYPSIMPNRYFDALIGFSQFSASTYPSAAYVFKSDQEQNQFRFSHVYKAGEAPFVVYDGDVNRWGDWSATMVDPVNDVDFWTLQEFAFAPIANEDRWGTWWARVSPPVDLRVTMNDSPDPVRAAEILSYQVAITNQAPSSPLASGIRLTNEIPTGLRFDSASSSQGACLVMGNEIVCDLGTLTASNRITVTLRFQVLTNNLVQNSVTVAANGPDTNLDNNTASSVTGVIPAPDLSISGFVDPAQAAPGTPLTYTLVVTNSAPAAAQNSRLTNTLPANVSALSFTASQGTCTQNGRTVICNLGTLNAHGSATVVLMTQADTSGPAELQASVGSGTRELDVSNNRIVLSATVNAPPNLTSLEDLVIFEDETVGPLDLTVSDAESPAASLILAVTSSNTNLVPETNLLLTGTNNLRQLSIVPLPQRSGMTTITLTLFDPQGGTTIESFLLQVIALNDPPSISPIPSQDMDEDTVLGPIEFTVSDDETAPSRLAMLRTSSNRELIPLDHVVLGGQGATRTITIRPAENLSGESTITLLISDGQYLANVKFLVRVHAVNDPPTISIIDPQTLDEDTVSGQVDFMVSDVDHPAESLTLATAASPPDFVPPANVVFGGEGTNRTLMFAPGPNQFGEGILFVQVFDPDGGSNQMSIALTVNPINDPPTMDAIPDLEVQEDPGLLNLLLTGISAGVGNETGEVAFSATSNNPDLIPHPVILYASPQTQGTLRLQPGVNMSGTATITVVANDGQPFNGLTTNQFDITVLPVNDPPTATAIANQRIDEDTTTGSLPFTIGDVDSNVASLTVTSSSSNPTLVPASAMVLSGTGASRTLTITPTTNRFGLATVFISVSDGQAANTIAFLLQVNPVNDPPTATAIANQRIDEDTTTGPLPFTIGDVDSNVASLTVTSSSSNPGLLPASAMVLSGTGASRSLRITPATNQFGSATVFVFVSDGLATNTAAFNFQVDPVNDPPTLNPLDDIVLEANAPEQSMSLTGISVGVFNEPDTLLLTAQSSRPEIVPNPNIAYTQSETTGLLRLRPAPGRYGQVTITVTADDGADMNATVQQRFQVTVSPPAPPALTIRLESDQVVVSWPSDAPGFQLQQRSAWDSTPWEAVEVQPALMDGEFTVTLPLEPVSTYYRLVN